MTYETIRPRCDKSGGRPENGPHDSRAGGVFLDDGFLKRRQSVGDQMNRLAVVEHQLPEQRHEQFTAVPNFVSCKPEGNLRVDGRRRARTLLLAQTLDKGCFTARRPGPAMHRVGTETRFVPEDVGVFVAGKSGNGWIRVVLPMLTCQQGACRG